MESSYKKRGKLTIYLGYSPGVGKTYEMLSNGIDLYKEGQILRLGILNPINVLRQMHLRNNCQKLSHLVEDLAVINFTI